MLGFLFHKKRDEVKRILHGRMNRTYVRTVTANNNRGSNRGSFSEVVWVIPCRTVAKANYINVFPAMAKDISTQGISILHHTPISEPRVILGLKDETEPRFLLCTVAHSTPLGYGFHQIGVHPDEVVHIEPDAIELMQAALANYESAAEEPVAVAH